VIGRLKRCPSPHNSHPNPSSWTLAVVHWACIGRTATSARSPTNSCAIAVRAPRARGRRRSLQRPQVHFPCLVRASSSRSAPNWWGVTRCRFSGMTGTRQESTRSIICGIFVLAPNARRGTRSKIKQRALSLRRTVWCV